MKDFLIIDDSGKPEIWIREKYEKYVRSVLGLGACPAVRIITEFNFDESLFTEIKDDDWQMGAPDKLFKFFADEHNLILTDGEISDIIHAVIEYTK